MNAYIQYIYTVFQRNAVLFNFQFIKDVSPFPQHW